MVSRDLQLRFETIWEAQACRIVRLQDLELLTLRCHALLEVGLQDLLAVRLDIPVSTLPMLTFEKLARLSLGGLRHELVDIALGVNKIRNYVAHGVHADELEAKIGDLIKSNRILNTEWPPNTSPKHERWANILNATLIAVSTIKTALDEFKTEHSDPNRTTQVSDGYAALLFSVYAAASLNIGRMEAGEPLWETV
jgi:hypothetical protein